MKETYIKELQQIQPNAPVLLEGLPGLGLVGKIVMRYLIKQLKAQKIAYLYSPHFPYFVLVNKKGNIRLLRGTFYYWKNPNVDANDLILFTGDSQSQTIEGQYELTDCLLGYAEKYHVHDIVTIGGYRMETKDKPKVFAAATNKNLLDKSITAGAFLSSSGSPIVGTAGLILGLSEFKKIDAICLLGETRGYIPDPLAAKSVIEVLKNLYNFDVDLTDLDKEIDKADKMVIRLQAIEEQRALQEEEIKKEDEKKTTYIS